MLYQYGPTSVQKWLLAHAPALERLTQIKIDVLPAWKGPPAE